ncbi:MAG: hypothetical protein IRZ00_07425 [Gemmatimonadetes bacterium]|nr:hypothetical protein [Gemmatimonadota bacterium]
MHSLEDLFARHAAAGAAGPDRLADGDEREAAFRAFAGREADAIRAELDAAVRVLRTNPRDRAPLRRVLERQRALGRAAGLRAFPVLAETLAAVEAITRIVQRLDAPVKSGWLDVYRAAHDVLASAAAALRAGDEPRPGPAFSRLRTLRDELFERYARPAAPTDAVPVERFFYRGERALRRALELRAPVEAAVAARDPRAPDLVRELFDLLQLATS